MFQLECAVVNANVKQAVSSDVNMPRVSRSEGENRGEQGQVFRDPCSVGNQRIDQCLQVPRISTGGIIDIIRCRYRCRCIDSMKKERDDLKRQWGW